MRDRDIRVRYGVVCVAAGVCAAVLGLESGHLYPAVIGLITLAPLASHIRHVGWKNAISEPSPITLILAFYVLFFPLRGLVVAASGYTDLLLQRLPISSGNLLSLLLLAAVATTLFVEAYYFVRPWKPIQRRRSREAAPRHAAVLRLALLLSGIILLSLAVVVLQHGGIAGTRAQTLSHSGLDALQGKTAGGVSTVWELFAAPTAWACAYVIFDAGTPRRWRWSLTGVIALIMVSELYLYGSRLQTILVLIGVWIAYHYSGRRISTKWLVVIAFIGIVGSQPIISTRGNASLEAVSSVERYSRITSYGVLDVALAIHRQPQALRVQMRQVTRWTNLPAYFVPSFLWHGRPNINSVSLNYATSRDIGASNQIGTGLPSTFLTEAWLLGGPIGAVIWAIVFGALLAWVSNKVVGRAERPEAARVLAYCFVVTTGWNYFKDGDVVTTIVGQARLAIYLLLLLWLTGVVGNGRLWSRARMGKAVLAGHSASNSG